MRRSGRTRGSASTARKPIISSTFCASSPATRCSSSTVATASGARPWPARGAGALKPVFTARTQASRVNLERMRANVIEAAEQCGILALPTVLRDELFAAAFKAIGGNHVVLFCDEDAPVSNPLRALDRARNIPAKFAVVVGPEGGFTDEERALVLGHPNAVRISLGPRVLRADTAAVAALALVQAALGDWR